MAKQKRRTISLALQGGGAHGAYTWGVLDRLAEEENLEIAAMSATSAGAMNAVAWADGMAEHGPEGAKAKLEAMWRSVSQSGSNMAPYGALSKALPARTTSIRSISTRCAGLSNR